MAETPCGVMCLLNPSLSNKVNPLFYLWLNLILVLGFGIEHQEDSVTPIVFLSGVKGGEGWSRVVECGDVSDRTLCGQCTTV